MRIASVYRNQNKKRYNFDFSLFVNHSHVLSAQAF